MIGKRFLIVLLILSLLMVCVVPCYSQGGRDYQARVLTVSKWIDLSGRLYNRQIILFVDEDATPSVYNGNVFKTANTGATTITMFDNGITGQQILLIIDDAFTSIDFTGTNLIGNSGVDWTANDNDILSATFDGTNWFCEIESMALGGNLTVTGNAEIGDELHGTTLNDNFSYMLAGKVLENATTPPLILAWITPATTEVDLSGNGNDATYSNFATTDQIYKGLVWALSFYDGIEEYLTVGDDPAFSWDDTGNNPWSFCGWIEVVATGNIQTVIAKYSVQGTDREWKIVLDAAEKMEFALFDEADDKESTNITDAALAVGWHFVVHTYDSTGGATALSDTNSIWYVDGIAVAESQSNDADYTGMVAGATDVTIGSYNTGAGQGNFFQGDMGILWFEDVELTAAQVWAAYIATRGFYNE